jgi:hypothetical protein
MDNLKEPSYPLIHWETADNGAPGMFSNGGFTKLEMAALMIAQGYVSDRNNMLKGTANYEGIAQLSITIAKAVLEESNK